MMQYREHMAQPNWALRGWLATFGVVACTMLFVFTFHANYETYLAEQADAEAQAELLANAVEFTKWRQADETVLGSAQDFLEVVEATSASVSELVSFDFDIIEQAQVNAEERQCMAEAIYFEAGFEPVIGQMAVADVVLNRVESTQYPNTVCGVVYQGSHRKTGCQFSFTCDGSLNRKRHKPTFEASYEMAGAILAGVHLPVSNNATHYHADYVQPYWAPRLTKTAEIGAHRFYRYPDKKTVSIASAAQ